MTDRTEQLQHWAAVQLHAVFLPAARFDPSFELAVWDIVSGDASFRQYFRTRFEGASYILMDAPPEQEDSASFIDVAKRLQRANIRSPRIYASDLELGFLLLEDFGDEMLQSLLQSEAGQALFDRVLPLLANMSAQCDCSGLAEYSEAKLYSELALFPDWYLARNLEITLSRHEQLLWDQLCALLVASAKAQPQSFVHRDFHSCNLHALVDGSTGVIDFQDAVYGPVSYDLVSWLWDRYIVWSRSDLEKWMLQAQERLAPTIESVDWLRFCDLMGLQRNLKIIGIFSRLHYRDNKSGYLDMVPHFSGYVLDVLSRYDDLERYHLMFKRWLQR